MSNRPENQDISALDIQLGLRLLQRKQTTTKSVNGKLIITIDLNHIEGINFNEESLYILTIENDTQLDGRLSKVHWMEYTNEKKALDYYRGIPRFDKKLSRIKEGVNNELYVDMWDNNLGIWFKMSKVMPK